MYDVSNHSARSSLSWRQCVITWETYFWLYFQKGLAKKEAPAWMRVASFHGLLPALNEREKVS